MKDVKYIPEQKAWLVDGKLIKEETLTPAEKKKLLEASTGNLTLLIGQSKETKQLI
jgi:hypothetical protein